MRSDKMNEHMGNIQPTGRSKPNIPSSHSPRMENILIAGTSLTNRLNRQVIQNVTNCNVTTVKAFTIDEKDGNVKPELNHRRIVPAELSKHHYDILVLEGGVNEISNLDTKHDVIENFDAWKKKVAEDSLNMYNLAENSLRDNPNMKKVIILKRIFRCDDMIKESLSQ